MVIKNHFHWNFNQLPLFSIDVKFSRSAPPPSPPQSLKREDETMKQPLVDALSKMNVLLDNCFIKYLAECAVNIFEKQQWRSILAKIKANRPQSQDCLKTIIMQNTSLWVLLLGTLNLGNNTNHTIVLDAAQKPCQSFRSFLLSLFLLSITCICWHDVLFMFY